MTQFYSLTTSFPTFLSKLFLSTLLFFSLSTHAQVYNAVRPGNWQADIPANSIWDVSGQPPANCNNCVITLQSGNAVTLNTSVTLSGNTQLQIGDHTTTGGAQLTVPASGSAGTGLASGFNVIMDNTGGMGNSKIVLFDNASIISVPVTSPTSAGKYDGIFSSNSGYTKTIGNLPVQFFSDGTIQSIGNISRNSLTGPITLTAFGDLPIILSAFTAVLDNKAVDLNWTSSLEINSDHFAIERSVDAGAHWNVLGTVAAHGSSTLAVDYSFTDVTPPAGTNEYRLQLVDRDGKYTYSGVKTIRTNLVSSVNIYPNPARDYVNIALGSGEASTSVSIRLISQSGQLLLEKKVDNAGGTTVSLPVSSYPQGNYLILVTGTDGVPQVNKLLISKQ